MERKAISSNDRRNKKYLDKLMQLSQREERSYLNYGEDALSDDYKMYLELYAVIRRMKNKKELHDKRLITDSKYIAELDGILGSVLEED